MACGGPISVQKHAKSLRFGFKIISAGPKMGCLCFPQWFDVFGLGQKTLEFVCFLNVSWKQVRGVWGAESKTISFPKAGKF